MKKTAGLLLLGTLLFSSCKEHSNEANEPVINQAIQAPAVINYTIVKVFPHDTSSYTQGLFWHNNALYEGTGWYGEGKILTIDPASGKAENKVTIGDQYFGEGITLLNNKIYQLTWQEHKVFVYDAASFKKVKEFDWTYEGWGLTTDGKQLIISTGGSNLYYVNPETFKVERTLGVSDNNGYVSNLNELEFVDGSIYANIYNTDLIVKINPATGSVTGRMDFTDLLQKTNQPIYPNKDVLNGIAYDAARKSFYITGKRWPALYEIKLN
ncbi:MAG TPA: glutaminyl-peptide cyclotransferase [Sediminibacterium sp.]|nr:glutaminyl-peptide cyclotransferase [Sediminibacterium sp.]